MALVRYDSKWKKHLSREGKKKRWVIYVQYNKAACRTIGAAIIAYQKLTSYFKKWGFKANPYDLCVWNATIEGLQMTIVSHVDDLKISHKNCEAIQVIVDKLNKIYGKREKMKIKEELSLLLICFLMLTDLLLSKEELMTMFGLLTAMEELSMIGLSDLTIVSCNNAGCRLFVVLQI